MGPIWAHMGPNPDWAPTRTGPLEDMRTYVEHKSGRKTLTQKEGLLDRGLSQRFCRGPGWGPYGPIWALMVPYMGPYEPL